MHTHIHFTLSSHTNFLTLNVFFCSSFDFFLFSSLLLSFAFYFACLCIWRSFDIVWFIPITQCTSDPFGFKWLCHIFCSSFDLLKHTQDNTHTNHRMDMHRNRNEITTRTIQSNIKRWTDDAIHHRKSMYNQLYRLHFRC